MVLGLYLGFFAVRFAREPRRRSEGVEFLVDIVGGESYGSRNFSAVGYYSPNPIKIFRTKHNTKNRSCLFCSRVSRGSIRSLLNLILLFPPQKVHPHGRLGSIITIRFKHSPRSVSIKAEAGDGCTSHLW